MKPGFALDLSQDGISLLHRAARGWLLVGEVSLDHPDFDAAMAALRRDAGAIAPDGVTTKLILPESEVLYTELSAPGPDSASRRLQILRALDGRTPYDVSELAFDWSGTGRDVQVAVAARVTLEEAEEFALKYGFGPVSFVARPASGRFGGEPCFGLTATSGDVIPAGERLDRDQDPVRIVGKAEIPAPPQVAEPPVAPAAALAEPADTAAMVAPDPATPVAPDVVPYVVPAPADPAAQRPLDTDAAVDAAESTSELPVPELTVPDLPVPELPVPEAADPAALPAGDMPAAEAPKPAAPEPATPITEPSVTSPGIPAPAAFSTRRAADAAPSGSGSRIAGLVPRLGVAAADAPPGTGSALANAVDASGGLRALKVTEPAAPAKGKHGKSARAQARAEERARKIKADDTAPTAPRFTPFTPKPASTTSGPPPAAPTPRTTEPVAAPATTAFGARKKPVGGKPRHLGLMLTAALVVFLGLTAIWASLFTSDDSTANVEATAALTPAAEPDADPADLPTDAELAASEAAETPPLEETPTAVEPPLTEAPATETPAEPADMAAATGADTATATAAADPSLPTSGDADAAVAEALGTDLPADAPPLADPAISTANGPAPEADGPGATPETAIVPEQDDSTDIVVALPDAAPGATEAGDLPPATALGADSAIPPPPLPPAFGTKFRFDAAGRIIPETEGIVTPEGFTLFAGKPDLAPPLKPGTTPPPRVESSAPPAPKLRPLPRPASIAPAAASPPDAALPPPADDAALQPTGPRPVKRSAVALAAAAAARETAERAAVEAAVAAAAPAPAAVTGGSRLAVATSPRPALRPRDFSRAVEQALAAAVVATPAPPVAAPPPVAAAAPEDIDEPEPVAAAPAIPTRASVAKQATFANAISLSKMNLIGVYGSSSSRRALVRLSSGKYVKVKVGERLDGGRVAAISETQLSYVKNGKTVVLAMPKDG